MRPPLLLAKLFALALRELRVALLDAAPPEARADVARLLDESEHMAACACAAAGLHPRARAEIEVAVRTEEASHAA